MQPGSDWGAPIEGGPLDRLDLTVYTGTGNGDAMVQWRVDNGWQPPEGLRLRKGLFRSIPGLQAAYPRGATAVRFKRADPATPAILDVDGWSVG